ncbi:hypothetical protein CKAN_02785600 [Cinnamomum micranthum f. kanehirae]|uniref:Uncharacterized protein n=1 Tax=Cinnamomum micranthum f. kanehirae TaxID=337451 RepID=A0A3S4Q3C9_9MAGN|nr:hypothetical protein CKAN_02785600 [Cinnamomum micranthum f. kanehirae]
MSRNPPLFEDVLSVEEHVLGNLSRGSFKTYSNYYSTENESFGFTLIGIEAGEREVFVVCGSLG